MTTAPADTDADRVAIRQAERADLLSVYRIEKACFDQPWPFSAFERFVGETAFLVAVRGGTIVGYVVADTTPNYGRDLGHVKDIAVRPDAQGRGIGRRLLERALVSLAVDGASVVKLEVREGNDRAQALYRDVGFESMRRVPRYYGDGEAALIMVLDVPEWRDRNASA